MLECKNLTYRAGSATILDGVSLVARDGEITVVVGNNGSGKTTLIRSFSTYHEHKPHVFGEMLVDSLAVPTLSPRELARRISLLPQSLGRPAITTEELVMLGRASLRSPFSHTTEEDRRAVALAIEELGLSSLAIRPLPNLSGGELQSAYFAMLLAKNAKNLMLDEPTSSLDSVRRALVFSFLRGMRERGSAVLLVLHDLTDAVRIADKIAVMDKGRIIFDGTPSELEHSGIPERIFGLSAAKAEMEGALTTVYLPVGRDYSQK